MPSSMTPRQLFRVVVATIGLYYFLQGLMFLFEYVCFTIHLATPPTEGRFTTHFTTQWYAVRGIFGMLIGFFMISGLLGIDRVAFPRHRRQKDEGDCSGDDESPNSNEALRRL